jgi:L-ascorbate metabolism protein UlaG (beta-lactamase superfamily)
MQINYLGHSAFQLVDGDTSVLIDPFLTGNPKAAADPATIDATTILLTHGHSDHYGDTVPIAQRTGANVQAITELAGEIAAEGIETVDTNIGGTGVHPWGWARLTPAFHTSTTDKGTVTPPAGLVVGFGGLVIYHLGDTGLFSDLALPGRRDPIDVAIIPIGGHYTMDRHDAVEAAKLVGAKTVIPCHYNTFPAIETDAQAFKADVEAAGAGTVVVLDPGGTWSP